MEIANASGVVAVAAWAVHADRLDLGVLTTRTFGMVRADVAEIFDTVHTAARPSGCQRIGLRSNDALVRTVARARGFEGPLRADLTCSDFFSHDVIGADADLRPLDRDAIATELMTLLPGTDVTLRRGSSPARVARRLETGIRGSERVSAQRAGVSVSAITPVGPDLMVESLAAALDTMLVISARFPTVAGRIPPIVFGMAAMDMAEGRVSGQAGSGRISINPAHVSMEVLETLVAREEQRVEHGEVAGRASRGPSGWYLPVDGVVAHEIGHCIDHLARNGRIADGTEFRRKIGTALGVESVELALRGRSPSAPPEWQRAYRDLVDQTSEYATTNGAELFAEIFKAWFEGADGPVAITFDRLMRETFGPAG